MIARVLSLCLALSGVSCAHAPRPQAPVDRPYPHREVVLPGGAAVLDASQPMLVDMAALCDGEVIFFATDAALPAVVEHRARGGRAVFVRAGEVVLGSSEQETAITSLRAIPLTDGGRIASQVDNVLAAAAAAWALGIGSEIIRTALETAANG